MGGSDERDAIDWAGIFDNVASEYGWGWEQFIELTFRQLRFYLTSISKRKYEHYRTIADFHGIKIEPHKQVKQPSKHELEQAENDAYEILRKKQAALNGK